jgi:hypothetical protein
MSRAVPLAEKGIFGRNIRQILASPVMDARTLRGGSLPPIVRARANPSLVRSKLDRVEYSMTIYKQPGSPYYYYDFYFEGRRYQKSTHLRNKTIAE